MNLLKPYQSLIFTKKAYVVRLVGFVGHCLFWAFAGQHNDKFWSWLQSAGQIKWCTRLKNGIFGNFDLFFGISVVLPQVLTRFVTRTIPLHISKKFPLIFFWINYFLMTYKGPSLDLKSHIMIKILDDFKMVSLQ